jgi:hypothetical protein
MPDYALVRVKNTKEIAPASEVLVWHRASMLVSLTGCFTPALTPLCSGASFLYFGRMMKLQYSVKTGTSAFGETTGVRTRYRIQLQRPCTHVPAEPGKSGYR